MSPSKIVEEPKLTLPVGHPEAGYVAPDLSYQEAAGTLPPEEQEWNEERDEAQQADAEAVAEHEDAVAKAEAGAPDPKKATTTKKAASHDT